MPPTTAPLVCCPACGSSRRLYVHADPTDGLTLTTVSCAACGSVTVGTLIPVCEPVRRSA
jgi:hypothetical protein